MRQDEEDKKQPECCRRNNEENLLRPDHAYDSSETSSRSVRTGLREEPFTWQLWSRRCRCRA
jgi:hypothetical protein